MDIAIPTSAVTPPAAASWGFETLNSYRSYVAIAGGITAVIGFAVHVLALKIIGCALLAIAVISWVHQKWNQPSAKPIESIPPRLMTQRPGLKLYQPDQWQKLLPAITVTEEDTNKFLSYRAGETTMVTHAKNVKFFFGNCDQGLSGGKKDLGWGCAWRSIQTCLSSLNHFPTFESLSDRFRRDPGLPQEWAEPGYGKTICNELQIVSGLTLYGRSEGSDKTPTSECGSFESFERLVSNLLTHFREFGTPVMFDDGFTARSILGIKTLNPEKTKAVLWIADPHKTSKEDGLFYVVLDEKEAPISTGKDGGNGLPTAHTINPKNRGWMLFFPCERK